MLSHRKIKGQGLLEYIALTALIAIVSISAVKLLGSKVQQHITRVTNNFDRNMRTGARSQQNAATSDDESSAPQRRPDRRTSIGGITLPF